MLKLIAMFIATPAPHPEPVATDRRAIGIWIALALALIAPPGIGPVVGQGPDDPGDVAIESRPDTDTGIAAELEAYRKELRDIADRYAPPPNAKQLSKLPDLWVDLKSKRVYLDGYVAMRRGPLEMFACPVGTKEHESIVAAFAPSSEVHAALLAIGTQTGTPVRWEPRFLPPTGQEVQIWVTWRDKAGKFQVADARTWLQNTQTNESMKPAWVFAGSSFWKDPDDGVEVYTADGGDMICVSNFTTSMLDVPFDSSAQAGNLLFTPFTDRIPDEATPVRLVLVPQPIPTDKPPGNDPIDPTLLPSTQPPDESMLPVPVAAPVAAPVLAPAAVPAAAPAKNPPSPK